MIPNKPTPPVTVDAFLTWYPENSEFRYALRRRVIS